MDEFTRRCLGIHSACRIRSRETPEVVAELMVGHVVPDYIRSDNGPETAAEALPTRLERMVTGTAYITPGSPWENGDWESFN